jgi:hypothetical protein
MKLYPPRGESLHRLCCADSPTDIVSHYAQSRMNEPAWGKKFVQNMIEYFPQVMGMRIESSLIVSSARFERRGRGGK